MGSGGLITLGEPSRRVCRFLGMMSNAFYSAFLVKITGGVRGGNDNSSLASGSTHVMGTIACGDCGRLVGGRRSADELDFCVWRAGRDGSTISQISGHRWCLAVPIEGAAAADHLYCWCCVEIELQRQRERLKKGFIT